MQTVTFSVKADPRSPAPDAAVAEWADRLAQIGNLMNRILVDLETARKARSQVLALMADFPDEAELQRAGELAVAGIGEWEAKITQLKHETYEDEDAWESMLLAQLRFLMDVIDYTGAPVTAGAMERLADLEAEWAQRQQELGGIVATHIEPLNAWARDQGIAHVATPGG